MTKHFQNENKELNKFSAEKKSKTTVSSHKFSLPENQQFLKVMKLKSNSKTKKSFLPKY
jgi:hypothetical protein